MLTLSASALIVLTQMFCHVSSCVNNDAAVKISLKNENVFMKCSITSFALVTKSSGCVGSRSPMLLIFILIFK